jgi:hypothetical protein
MALRTTGGAVRVLAPLSQSVYCQAGPEIVWLGGAASTLHPRAMLTHVPLAAWPATATGDLLRLDGAGLTPWTPARPQPRASSLAALTAGAQALLAAREGLGTPLGFAALLGGETAGFPLAAARERACALARALVDGDDERAADAAIALLGLGTGLTPSGDDLVGAAFFARASRAEIDGTGYAHRAAATGRVLAAAPALTHPISVALLADMLHGRGHAPLHDLATALAVGAPLHAALEAARRLTRIGHCSGWDMLAGLLAGILGAPVFSP